jgi:hypothetical protein
MTSRRRFALAVSAALICAPVFAGSWGSTRTLEPSFATASPPEAPQIAMNGHGHALMVWNVDGRVRYADRLANGDWRRARTVPGGATGAGPAAAAVGPGDVAAIAWTTVATRYVPSKLLVSLRVPGGTFGAAAEVAAGTGVRDLKLGVACDGSVTLLWNDVSGVQASQHAGIRGPGTCNGVPDAGTWTPPLLLSNSHTGAVLPDLAVNDAGTALAVWQEGAAGNLASIVAALRAGGTWQAAQTVSPPTGGATWSPKAGLDATDNAAIGYLDGNSMVVITRPAAGAWDAPSLLSGTQMVYYPAFAVSAQGDLLAAWQVLDAGSNGSVWQSTARFGGAWSAPARLSATSESASWPSAAIASDASVAVVGWVDDATNTVRASVGSSAGWQRSSLGPGWWGGTVAVGAGGGTALAAWANPINGNPNAGRLLARDWQ